MTHVRYISEIRGICMSYLGSLTAFKFNPPLYTVYGYALLCTNMKCTRFEASISDLWSALGFWLRSK